MGLPSFFFFGYKLIFIFHFPNHGASPCTFDIVENPLMSTMNLI
jgi:hypothetical protein